MVAFAKVAKSVFPALLLPLVLSACETAAPTGTPTSEPTAAPDVLVRNVPGLGDILVDARGMTLYVYTRDTQGLSTCTGACLTAWPPFVSSTGAEPNPGSGIVATFGVLDQTHQITVEDQPLYYYAQDRQPGDVLGQGVNGVWFVVDPAGNLIQTKPPAS
jgi:predicted lipoprotein with Yx(FWY)xxD motif